MTQIILPGLIVLASFSGGLLAVLLGQFLSFYREQRQEVEELFKILEHTQRIGPQSPIYSENIDDVNELRSQLAELYITNKWWMDEDLQENIEKIQKSLKIIETQLSDLEKLSRFGKIETKEDWNRLMELTDLDESELLPDLDSEVRGEVLEQLGEEQIEVIDKVKRHNERTINNVKRGYQDLSKTQSEEAQNQFQRIPLVYYIPRFFGMYNYDFD